MNPIPLQANTRSRSLVARADGTPITSGTVNYYLIANTGTNAGKWFKTSDNSWDASESIAAVMSHKADGHWSASVDAEAWPTSGVEYTEYAKESGDLHVPTQTMVRCEYAALRPTTPGRTLDIQATGEVDANVTMISADATAADILELFVEALKSDTGQLDNGSFAAGAIDATAIAAGAIDNATFADDVGSTAYADNIIALAVRKVLDELNLDHLLKIADDDDVIDNSVIAKLAASGATADWSTYVNTTDSLQSIRDVAPHGSTMVGTDGANTTVPDSAGTAPTADGIKTAIEAAGSHLALIKAATDLVTAARMGALDDWIDGGRLDLLLDAIPTTPMRGTENAALASVVGALADASAAGDPTSADTLMQYVKQLINVLVGTDGVATFPPEAAPGNAVSLAEVIRAIHADVTGVAGTAPNTVVPDVAGTAAALHATTDAAIGAIGVASGTGLNFAAEDDTVDGVIASAPVFSPLVPFVGVQTSGTYASTEADDGTYHQIDDDSDAIDIVYQFDVGGIHKAVQAIMRGYVDGLNDTVTVQAYDYIGGDWETRLLIGGTSAKQTYTINLLSKHTGTGDYAGKVLLRFVCSGQSNPTLYVDSLLVEAAIAGQSVGYANGAVWVKATGTSGTASYVNGTADNPCPWADALVIAAALGLTRFHIVNGETVTLSAGLTNSTMEGNLWTLALGGQAVSGCNISGATISGVSTGTGNNILGCTIGDGTTFGECNFSQCGFSGETTFLSGGDYVLDHCLDVTPSTSDNPTFIFAANVVAGVRKWSGGIELKGLASTNTVTLDGAGRLVLNANCSGTPQATITLRGFWADTTDNVAGGFLGTLTEVNRYDLAQINSQMDTALTDYDPPTATEMTNAFTEIKGGTWSSVTDTLEHIRNKQTDIETDTAEIGTAGNGLTNINLPNQTMNITGDITGNLSGSVGSVSGAVGSVTGAVGSVSGAVGSVTAAVTTDSASRTASKATGFATPTNITAASGVALSAAGLDAVAATEPSGKPTTFPGKVLWLVQRFWRADKTPTKVTVKTEADATVTEQTITDDGAGTETLGTPS